MDFEFECGWCGTDNAVYGKPAGFWTEQYRLPEEWDCWNCGGLNYTPDD
jgi:hypothetical protein